MKMYFCTKTHTWLFIEALFIIAKKWKQPKCPPADEGVNKMWCIHTMEYYLTINRKEMIYTTTWMSITNIMLGLPWWRSGWESACQCRGHGFEPWSGKIPHAVEQLGPWARTTEPARLELVLRKKRACHGERPAHRDEEWPPLTATRERPCTETKTQHSQKNK